GDEIATVATTLGVLSRGVSFATTAYGGDGDDDFVVYSNRAPLTLYGEDGFDDVTVHGFLIRSAASGLSYYSVDATVSVDGGTGVNSLVAIATEANDALVVSKDSI